MARTRVITVSEISSDEPGYRQPIFVSSDPQLLRQVGSLVADRIGAAPRAKQAVLRPLRAVPAPKAKPTPAGE